MELTRISATKFKTYVSCPARYKAEYIDGGRGGSSPGLPALTGSAVHAAHEGYVQKVYIDKTHEPTQDLLLAELDAAWPEIFDGPPSGEPEAYKDAKGMCKTWFERTDFTDVTVLTTEYKAIRNIEVPGGERQFTYIFDRCDFFIDEVTGERVIRVVDLKTFRMNRTFEDIDRDLQMRMYAVGAMLDYKDQCDRIDVQMDLLRHAAVTVTYTIEEIRQFYVDIWTIAGEILADETAKERLNSECIFCVRKSTCGTVRKNIASGGALGLVGEGADQAELLAAFHEVSAAEKAAKSAKDELSEIIRATFDREQLKDLNANGYKATLRSTSRRVIDTERAMAVLPPEVIAKAATLAVGKVQDAYDKGDIDKATWDKFDAVAVSKTTSAPSVTVKKT